MMSLAIRSASLSVHSTSLLQPAFMPPFQTTNDNRNGDDNNEDNYDGGIHHIFFFNVKEES